MNFLSSLRRRPRSGRYMPEVDGLRFIAIAWVVVGHVWHFWSGTFAAAELRQAGWSESFVAMMQHNGVGVLLFFAISGYVLALPFAGGKAAKTISRRNYFLRRLVRIEPPYFIVMTAIFLLHILTEAGSIPRGGPHYAASMGYLHNVLFPGESGLNVVAWSLEIEVQFYLLAPLLFRVFRLPGLMRNALLVAGIIVFSILPLLWSPGVLTLYNYLGFFLIGVALAGVRDARFFREKLPPAALWALMASAIVAVATLGPLGYLLPQQTYELITPICIVPVMMAALAPTPLRRIFRWSPPAIIGGMCYSIYLTHSLLLAALVSRGWYPLVGEARGWAFVAAAVMLCAAVLVVGTLVYRLVEQPFMRLSARYRLVEQRAFRNDKEAA